MIQQNRYNGDGQRIQKVEGSKTTNYYYQDGVVSYTTDGDNSQTSQNLIGTDGNILATQRYGSDHTDYLLYHKDIQGSSTSLVKEDGSADATYRYTDFGETTINGDNKAENEVCYTGGIYDQSTGLYYLNARYYNPEDGGFLTEDTYRGEINEPETQNLYVYCADNPINYVDPSGHKGAFREHIGFWNSKQKYFAYNQNAPQKYLGYCNAYDYAANKFGMDIKNKKFITDHWRLEFWKGKYGKMYGYGISSGCEIGLYYRKNPNASFWLCASSKGKRLRMKMSLYPKGYSKPLFSRDSQNTTKQKKAWWLTAFQPANYQPRKWARGKNSLRMTGKIYFYNSSKYNISKLSKKFVTKDNFVVKNVTSNGRVKSFSWNY